MGVNSMKMTHACTSAMIAAASISSSAMATTVFYSTSAQFAAAATSALNTDTFSSYATGTHAGSFVLANSTFTAAPNSPQISNSNIFCTATGNNCLIANSISGARIFSNFDPSTTGFALDAKFLNPGNSFTVTLVTGDGTQSFTQLGSAFSGFFGFSDTSGIQSVSFLNNGSSGGFSNYSFDNVSTFTGTITSSAVPEPASWAMMIAGFGAVGGALRRTRKVAVRFS